MRAVLAVVAALLFAAPAGATTIYVSNTATNVTDASLADALPAFQAAVDYDFAPVWNQAATLVLLPKGEAAPPGGWTLAVSDWSDARGAAGYHTTCAFDTPCGKVFTKEGFNWQLVFTHELFEMLADSHVDRATFVWPTTNFYILEVCDPVEHQKWSYLRPSATGQPVVISDFVTERWYEGHGDGPLDFRGYVKHHHHVLYGGYQTLFTNGWWNADRVDGQRASLFRRRP